MSGPVVFDMFSQPAHALAPSTSCPNCGTQVDPAHEATRRVQELEYQVRELNTKASHAVHKLADYEDEVQKLRAQCARLQAQTPVSALPQSPESQRTSSEERKISAAPFLLYNNNSTSPQRTASRLASLSAYLPGRKRDAQTPTPTSATPVLAPSAQISSLASRSTPILGASMNSEYMVTIPVATMSSTATTAAPIQEPRSQPLSLQTLQHSLEEEQRLRLQAEKSLTQTQVELEELTASLFGQANEMVAQERKARARLEERVKILETRDSDKRRRLERLEVALKRIERVRGLVDTVLPAVGTVDGDTGPGITRVGTDEVVSEEEMTQSRRPLQGIGRGSQAARPRRSTGGHQREATL